MSELRDKVAIITGASSGIGEGVARELSNAGMKLVLTARRVDRIDALAEELGGADYCRPVAGDMADPALPQQLLDAALESFSRCDAVFNNAGVMQVGSIQDLDLDAACQMVRVNVEGVYRLAYLALRHFLKNGSGDLINVSSTLGTKVRPNTGPYCGTKFAVEALSEDLRMQCAGTGVRVSVLEPGLTDTNLQNHFPEHPAQTLGIRQMATPTDMARAVRWILEQPAHVSVPRLMMQPSEQPM